MCSCVLLKTKKTILHKMRCGLNTVASECLQWLQSLATSTLMCQIRLRNISPPFYSGHHDRLGNNSAINYCCLLVLLTLANYLSHPRMSSKKRNRQEIITHVYRRTDAIGVVKLGRKEQKQTAVMLNRNFATDATLLLFDYVAPNDSFAFLIAHIHI